MTYLSFLLSSSTFKQILLNALITALEIFLSFDQTNENICCSSFLYTFDLHSNVDH